MENCSSLIGSLPAELTRLILEECESSNPAVKLTCKLWNTIANQIEQTRFGAFRPQPRWLHLKPSKPKIYFIHLVPGFIYAKTGEETALWLNQDSGEEVVKETEKQSPEGNFFANKSWDGGTLTITNRKTGNRIKIAKTLDIGEGIDDEGNEYGIIQEVPFSDYSITHDCVITVNGGIDIWDINDGSLKFSHPEPRRLIYEKAKIYKNLIIAVAGLYEGAVYLRQQQLIIMDLEKGTIYRKIPLLEKNSVDNYLHVRSFDVIEGKIYLLFDDHSLSIVDFTLLTKIINPAIIPVGNIESLKIQDMGPVAWPEHNSTTILESNIYSIHNIDGQLKILEGEQLIFSSIEGESYSKPFILNHYLFAIYRSSYYDSGLDLTVLNKPVLKIIDLHTFKELNSFSARKIKDFFINSDTQKIYFDHGNGLVTVLDFTRFRRIDNPIQEYGHRRFTFVNSQEIKHLKVENLVTNQIKIISCDPAVTSFVVKNKRIYLLSQNTTEQVIYMDLAFEECF